MQAVSPLVPGDRVPNFLLPDQEGIKRSFYHELTGGPILLLALEGGEDAAANELVLAAAGLSADFGAAGVQVFALTGADRVVNKMLADAHGLGFRVFADPDRSALAFLLAGQAAVPCRSYLLDPNQRVLQVSEASGRKGLEALLERAKRIASQAPAPLVLDLPAPVLVLPEVFDAAFCRRLIDFWAEEHHEGGVSIGKGNIYGQAGKRTLERVVQEPELIREISRTLARRIGPELTKVFNYSAPFAFDLHIVMSYQPQREDFFGLHRDDLRQETRRRFAVSLNLNDDFEGGELIFPEYSVHKYKMPAGAAAVFAVSLLHEALPVTRGQRWVLTSFLCDPPRASGEGQKQRLKQVQL